jgi:hypothetical protein
MAFFDSSSLIGKKMTCEILCNACFFFLVSITKVGLKLFDEKIFFDEFKASVKTCYFRIGI